MASSTDRTAVTDQQWPPSFLGRFFSCVYLSILIALVIGTFATFFAKQHWIAEIFCHGRVQLSIGLFLWLFIAVLCKQKLRAFTALVFLVVNAAWIVPYFVPHFDSNVADGPTIKIMSANVLTSNDQYASFIKTVSQHDPDIAIVIEVDQRWTEKIEGALSADYPHQRIVAKAHNFGIGIISKLPFSSIDTWVAPDTELISLDARFVGPSGRPFRLIATHPFPPLSQDCFTSRSGQLIRLAQQLDVTQDNIIAGDFNLTPWSPIFSEVLEAGELKDSRVGFGVAATWYAYPTFLASLQIDHLITSQSLTTISHEVSENYGSDHRAIIVELQQSDIPMNNRPDPLPASSSVTESDSSNSDSVIDP